MESFWLAFIPLFVSVDAIGTLPIFISLTEGIERKRMRFIVIQSIVTALIVGILFLIVGNQLLKVLGITIADFMIAGGILLFLLSVRDLISFEKLHVPPDGEGLGAVPIGVPLIVGPAVLTTGMLLIDQQGYLLTILCMSINVLIAGVLFWFASGISRLMGKTGAKTVSKVAALLLAAFAVMMVRKGIFLYLN
jgi:multiple antibiotic resistance protein